MALFCKCDCCGDIEPLETDAVHRCPDCEAKGANPIGKRTVHGHTTTRGNGHGGHERVETPVLDLLDSVADMFGGKDD